MLPAYRLNSIDVQDCGGGWRFHLLSTEVEAPFEAYAVEETDATGWFTQEEMRKLPLHSGVNRWLGECGTGNTGR